MIIRRANCGHIIMQSERYYYSDVSFKYYHTACPIPVEIEEESDDYILCKGVEDYL